MKRFLTFLLVLRLFVPSLSADEGMWIPLLLEKYNIQTMREMGFRLTAEDVYSVNQACMKDAVLLFGGGCTGEVISPDGLLITNHHCGYGQIQYHSTLDNDYLTDGFWAMSHEEELACPGLSVTFLKRMEDVTERVMVGVTGDMEESRRSTAINDNIAIIVSEAVAENGYRADISPFYMGNQYFLFVYETFNDIRFVGAPPSAIGKFGGETDNWIWPRHTGDFSLFRIYAGSDNSPAVYSPDNVPYKPLYHFPISLKGVEEGDFTMIFGFPGSTNEYATSYHIDMVKNHVNPLMIDLRTTKIDILEEAMAADPMVRIQYSTKKSGIANSWKRWIGENQGLDKMNTVAKKQEYELHIMEWINSDEEREERFGDVLPLYEELYDKWTDYYLAYYYTNDVFFSTGAEAVGFSGNIRDLAALFKEDMPEEEIYEMKERLKSAAESFFRNYDIEVDKRMFVAVMEMYGENIVHEWQVPVYTSFAKSIKGEFGKVVDDIYSGSVFTDKTRYLEFIEGFNKRSIKKLGKDPLYLMGVGAAGFMTDFIITGYIELYREIQRLNRLYVQMQMEYERDKLFYPDANSTLRVAFGTVQGYNAEDGIYFRHYTTLKGIMEKDDPDVYDYDVPDRLRQLYEDRDFGRYVQDGEVPVCFVANNHTTGGNSGSPVINAEGHLIGVNFDRAWEGVASDMAFNPEQSRNISLDIRYALFIIDKFAGAGYLLDEMTIVE